MSEIKSRKSGVIIARPNDPLGACLDLMANANVGSILVADATGLVGIVTERDVLKNWRNLSDAAFRDGPVSALATKNVFSLPLAKISDAPKEMIERRIRHVPLVGDDGKILGIMSMRDILAAQLKARTLPQLQPVAAVKFKGLGSPTENLVHVVKPTAHLQDMAKGFLPPNWSIRTWGSFGELLDAPEAKKLGRQAVILDLDGIAGEDWRPLIRRLIKTLTKSDRPYVFLVSSQDIMAGKDLDVLRSVADKANWRIYLRPMPVPAFEQDLRALVRSLEEGSEEES